MADLTLKAKDKGKYITFTCLNADSSAKDLTGLTVTAKWWQEGIPDPPVVSGVCTAVGLPSAGICQYLLTGTDFTQAEFLMLELQYSVNGTLIDSSKTYTTQVLESP